MKKTWFLEALLLFALSSCATKNIPEQRFLTLLTFNVENLFDTTHDLGKMDYTFLPKSTKRTILKQSVDKYCSTVKNPVWFKECKELDWNESRLQAKLVRLAQVIRESTTGCPDILVLQEIENEKILKRLNSMLDCGYSTELISDDNDARGIDVALLSRFDLRSKTNHRIPFKDMDAEARKDTRSVLDVELSIRGFALRVLALHLPSPHRPARFRNEAIRYLEEISSKDSVATLIAGDWNVIEKEATKEKSFGRLRKNFIISDDIIRSTSNDKGTSYYKKEKTWSFLDKVALSRNSFDAVECKVVNFLPGQRERANGAPLSFPLFGKLKEGVSDHFPVLCRASY